MSIFETISDVIPTKNNFYIPLYYFSIVFYLVMTKLIKINLTFLRKNKFDYIFMY